ncbi:hypothetical protein PG989_013835 [Apiospora arundinis]
MAPTDSGMTTPLAQDSNGPWIITSTWALTAVGSFFVLLRFYCRLFRSHMFLFDDLLILIAWILLLAQTTMSAYGVGLGTGEHIWNIRPELSESLLMLQDINTAPSVLAVAFSKASAGVSLLRLLTLKWQRVLTIFIIVSIAVLMSGIIVLTYIQCIPIQKHWDYKVPGNCWPPYIVAKFGIAASIWSGVMDVVLALMPMPVILGLQMNKREKLGVAIALGFMVFAGASSFIKASTLINLSSTDPTYDVASVIVYGTAEIAVTIIAACIPVLRVLIRDVSRAGTVRYGHTAHTHGSTFHSKGGGGGSSSHNASFLRGTLASRNDIGVRPEKSRPISSQTKRTLEVMREKTIVIEYSCAPRDNWTLDPVNLSPRTLFDEQFDGTIRVPKEPV